MISPFDSDPVVLTQLEFVTVLGDVLDDVIVATDDDAVTDPLELVGERAGIVADEDDDDIDEVDDDEAGTLIPACKK